MQLNAFLALPFIFSEMPGEMDLLPSPQEALSQIAFHGSKSYSFNTLPSLHKDDAHMLFTNYIGTDNLAIRQSKAWFRISRTKRPKLFKPMHKISFSA